MVSEIVSAFTDTITLRHCFKVWVVASSTCLKRWSTMTLMDCHRLARGCLSSWAFRSLSLSFTGCLAKWH